MTKYLYKYFTDKSHMEQFIDGNVRFSSLAYYKHLEDKNNDSIADKNEGDYFFSPQKDDLIMTINFPGVEQITIKPEDLTKDPEFVYHLTPDYLNYFVFCSSIDDVSQQFIRENPNYKYYVKFDAVKFNDIFNQLIKICKQDRLEGKVQLNNGKSYILSVRGDKFIHGNIEYYNQELPLDKSSKYPVLRKTNTFKTQKEYRHCVYLDYMNLDNTNINDQLSASENDIDFIIQSNITINLGKIDTVSYGEISEKI